MMKLKLTGAALALILSAPMALAGGMKIEDAFARSTGANAKAGAIFFTLTNETGTDDRLIAVASDAADRTELHTHREDDHGVMKMIHLEDGFKVRAGERLVLKRGGHHVMLLGLTGALEEGDTVALTLTFETAGEVAVDVPVNLKARAGHGNHGNHKHGHSDEHEEEAHTSH